MNGSLDAAMATSLEKDISSSAPSFSAASLNSRKKSLYKTELCRSTEETGECPYGPKCQFAHSLAELRVLERHPRYKTEMCKTFWEHGTCPYGRRCCFIHTRTDANGMTFDAAGQNAAASLPAMLAGSAPKPKGLSLRTQSEAMPLTGITLHSPRARTVSQGFEGILDKEPTPKLDVQAGETASPQEIQSASIAMSSTNLFFGAPHRRLASADYAWDAAEGQGEFLDGQGHRSLRSKSSWEKNTFSPANSIQEHPWNTSDSPTLPTAPNVSGLGAAFGKLSVATDFSSEFKTHHVGSFSALPFQEPNYFSPSVKETQQTFFGSYSAYPDSVNANGFFPESIPGTSFKGPAGETFPSSYSRREFLSESVPNRTAFPESYSSSFKTTPPGIAVSSPLATSFEDPFSMAFSESSPAGFRSLNRTNRSRGALRDVWNASGPAQTPSTSPLLSASLPPHAVSLEKGAVPLVDPTSMISPPSSPITLPGVSMRKKL
ncbi:hypothetical protein HDU91_005432 [Kappamyces sp. JEL0680]|nr:hypothetical protein HDU91_005432 [Kappamyces sp. JEL0680]